MLNKVTDIAVDYRGSILAFAIMYIVVENTSKRDIIFRLALISLTAGEAEEIVQLLFLWGDSFHTMSQAIGVFCIWCTVGILKCVVHTKSRTVFFVRLRQILKASKWGK